MTLGSRSRCIRWQGIRIPRRRFPSRQMETFCCLLHCPRRPSSTTFGRSRLLQHGYTGSSMVPQRALKTHCCVERGAEKMEDAESQSEEPTGWSASGRSRAVEYCTRCVVYHRYTPCMTDFIPSASWPQRDRHLCRLPSQGTYQYVCLISLFPSYITNGLSAVLTGSKDGTMLLGEIEPSVTV